MNNTRFTPIGPFRWSGRYKRVPGDAWALHVTRIGDQWRPYGYRSINDETAQCLMAESEASEALALAVNAGKRALGGRDGGSFLINEFGQVLVPTQVESSFGDDQVVIVGVLEGPLFLHDPFDNNKPVDFADTTGLQTGSDWERPYFGIPYNLSFDNEIHFRDESNVSSLWTYPVTQDPELVEAIRQVRPRKYIRFFVSYGGLVLTKAEVGRWPNKQWEPRYVGRIDVNKWFTKEG